MKDYNKFGCRNQEHDLACLVAHFALVKLAPRSKRPIERGWQRKDPPSLTTVESWLRDGYGLGLRLGKQPDGAYLVAVDVDSADGANWLFSRWRAYLSHDP